MLVLILTATLWSAFAPAAAQQLDCPRCNVLFLNLDFLRADYVGLISDSEATPNLDEYFRNAIVFENAYSPAGSTYRGDLSVLTATVPHYYNMDVVTFSTLKLYDRLGKWENIYTAPLTVAQILSRHGYFTANLNKGNRSGQATFLDRGFERYIQIPFRIHMEDSLPMLLEQLSTASEPFFIHYHVIPTRLHRAYYPLDRERIDSPDILYFPYKEDGEPYGYKVIRNHGASVQRQRLAEHAIYRQQLEYADDALAKLFSALKPYENNTLIVFFSNHGTQIGDKGIFASNGVSYESSVRVPLMIRHPNVQQPLRVSTRISMLDLIPTIVEMLDIDPRAAVQDGTSMLDLIQTGRYGRGHLAGKNDPDEYLLDGDWKLVVTTVPQRSLYRRNQPAPYRRDHFDEKKVFANRIYYHDTFGFLSQGTIHWGEWELLVDDRREHELYNLAEDPHETTDLSARHPDIVRRLDRLLQEERRSAEKRLRQMANP